MEAFCWEGFSTGGILQEAFSCGGICAWRDFASKPFKISLTSGLLDNTFENGINPFLIMSINFGDFFLFAIDTIFAIYVDSTFVCSGGNSCVSLLFVRLPARFANANYVRLLQMLLKVIY